MTSKGARITWSGPRWETGRDVQLESQTSTTIPTGKVRGLGWGGGSWRQVGMEWGSRGGSWGKWLEPGAWQGQEEGGGPWEGHRLGVWMYQDG